MQLAKVDSRDKDSVEDVQNAGCTGMESEASMSASGWTLKLEGNGRQACETHDVGLLGRAPAAS